MFKVLFHQFLHKGITVLLVLAFAVGASGAQVVRAASLTVSNMDDSGAGSLRQAIADAQFGDTITFDSALSGQTITLTSGQMVIDKDLTISGLGSDQLAISGDHASRVFQVTEAVTVTIDGLTIRDGNAFDGEGGGAIENSGRLTLTNSVFSGNTSYLHGGAIENTGALDINNSTFTGNIANYDGGALRNERGTVHISDTTFIGNTVVHFSGGAIRNNIGDLTISNSVFQENIAPISGGAIDMPEGGDVTLTITNSTFSGNTVMDLSSSSGGAIYVFTRFGIVRIENSTFINNSSARDAGGIRVGGFTSTTVTLTNNTFINNSALRNGGAIYNDPGPIMTLTNSTLSGNNATNDGGGIFNTSTLTVINSTLSGNSATRGGGIFNRFDSTSTLRNTIIANSPSGGNCFNIENAVIVDGGGNLVWGDSTCPGINADPKLLPLADNGGPTQTMALDTGSAALDAAVPANCPAADQRGVTRPQGAGCDIGAFELAPASDSVAPTITITTPAQGTTYVLGQAVNVDYACAEEDGGSGLASCAGSAANGSLLDTSSIGPKSFTVNTADNAGNSASVTHNYGVVYNFSGFFQPVDHLPMLNVIKGGAGVSIKFSLNGNQGLNILAAGYPVSQRMTCDSSAPLDEIEQTINAGSSSLSYDATTNIYTYTWKTDKAWAGTCRQLVVKLSDGTEHKANFKFK